MSPLVVSLPALPSMGWDLDLPRVTALDSGVATVIAAVCAMTAAILTAALGSLTVWITSRGRQEARAAKEAAESAAYESKPNSGESGHDILAKHVDDLKAHFDNSVKTILGTIVSDRIARQLTDAEHAERITRLEEHLAHLGIPLSERNDGDRPADAHHPH